MTDTLTARELESLIGVTAAVDALVLGEVLDEHSLEVMARKLRRSAAQLGEESAAAFVHRRLDALIARLHVVHGQLPSIQDEPSLDSP